MSAAKSSKPWPVLAIAITGFIWAVVLYALVLLGFGINPSFPSAVAVAFGALLIVVALYLVPRWTRYSGWNAINTYALIFGTVLGSMVISFAGFIGTTGADLNFKIITNIAAVILLILLGSSLKKQKLLGA